MKKVYLIIGLLFLVISCDGIKKELINPEDIIFLTVLDADGNLLQNNSVSGDGETIVILRATIPKNTDKNFKTITFHKSAGNFVEVSSKDGKIVANSEGVAEMKLRVPLDNTEIFVTAQVSNGSETFSDEKNVNLEDVGEVIALNFQNINNNILTDIPRADGVSLIKLKGNILHNKKVLNSITFSATSGLFQAKNEPTETKNTDVNGEAIVNYIVPQTPGIVFYTAKTDDTGKYLDSKELEFQPANAEKIVIEPTEILMDTVTKNVINVFLTRTIGKVSIGTAVDFKSYQIINGAEDEVGRFIGTNEAKSDQNGLVSVKFVADTKDFDKDLPIFIRASATKDDNTTFKQEVALKIKK